MSSVNPMKISGSCRNVKETYFLIESYGKSSLRFLIEAVIKVFPIF
jgi:hypothetical protein